ncbi:unnamed protein product [Cuscuta campestris]|uniref:S phase cyclin A-associated protein in the endoplasmic reticulum N-terminal domain-containing protein n=1 Tax=Cuscuta campestris TaxID=132261 RepID=A0A484LZX2_9ASTE|nr:unnamed protein product [Cuscuta campestris]
MESGNVVGDDQSSGWKKVKKKHRSGSKCTTHSGTGGLTGISDSFAPCNGLLDVNCEKNESASLPLKPERNSFSHASNGLSNSWSVANNEETASHYLDKCVVSQVNISVYEPPLVVKNDTCKEVGDEHLQRNNNQEVLPKIKWGDLDDSALMIHSRDNGVPEIMFGEISNHNLVGRKNEKANDSLLPVDENPVSHLISQINESVEEKSKKINEVFSEDVKNQITSEKIIEHSSVVCAEGLSLPSIHEDSKVVEPSQNSESAVHGESFLEISTEDIRGEHNTIIDEFPRTHNIGAAEAGESGESKERFRQRLWCFLFENLNRAVDELYLLCELECDLEQMKEAILVLEEAASDFKELNSRVNEFENIKRTSSHLIDGTPLVMKSDHRRPHALSWEVRRMTTSPHRAEILASSLEAFRKIQYERAKAWGSDSGKLGSDCEASDTLKKCTERTQKNEYVMNSNGKEPVAKAGGKLNGASDLFHRSTNKEKGNIDANRSNPHACRLAQKDSGFVNAKNKKENINEKNSKPVDHLRKQIPHSEREKEKQNGMSWKSMDAWKEKRNWEDVLASPYRVSSRFSHSPGLSRKSAERARVLHDKLMSPEKKKKSSLDLKKEAEEKHARATRIRSELENERVQKLQRTSEKLNRVNEWQTVRSTKLREVMYARHQRSESRHEAYLAGIVRRAGDESIKVNEVRFITSLNEENKKLILRQKLHDSELRRAEKLQVLKTKQKEDTAREEAVLERKKLIEAEKLQRLSEIQRKKEEAQVRREEERKALSAAREARAMEQTRRKQVRAKAQQEEAELLAQKLAEKLRESEQRRKFYLEQIKERASMDFRDQSPLLRRKEVQGRCTPNSSSDDFLGNICSGSEGSILASSSTTLQHSLKRRVKKIRQRLMALKYDLIETSAGAENNGFAYRTAVATAKIKIGKWLQELQKLRQARNAGATPFGLIAAEIIKFIEGKDAELQAARQAGLLDFIASALPATHISKPEACQVTLYLLRLLRVVLSTPSNRSYFLAQNLLPPIIPMLAASLENYIKIAASSNASGTTNSNSSKISPDNLELISDVLDGFLWTAAAIIGHPRLDECDLRLQDGLIELVISYQIIHRLRDLFAIYDRPHVEGSPFPSSILLSINLLAVLTSRFRNMCLIDCKSIPKASNVEVKLDEIAEDEQLSSSCRQDATLPFEGVPLDTVRESAIASCDMQSDVVDTNLGSLSVSHKDENPVVNNSGGESKSGNELGSKQPAVAFLLSAVHETGLVCLPSMLTAVLLQANNRFSEPASYVLPSNFEEVATGVLKVLNNLALIDISFIQTMLARPDLKMEFFHLTSFLLSHCTNNWALATDQVGLLLMESLSLLGYFSLFHPENQSVLRWGKSPTILHKVCDLPFVFFSDPELMPVLAGVLVASCFGSSEQNKGIIQQELSTDMILSLLKACRNSLPSVCNNSWADELILKNPSSADLSQRFSPPSRGNCPPRNAQILSQKGGTLTSARTSKIRHYQKVGKGCEGGKYSMKRSNNSSCATAALMLNSRFAPSVIDKAEAFFAAD